MTGIVFEQLATSFGIGTSIAPACTTFGTDATGGVGISAAAFTSYGYDPTLAPGDLGEGGSIAALTTFGTDAADAGASSAPAFETHGAGFDFVPDVGIGSSIVFFDTVAETYEFEFDGVGSSSYGAFATMGADVANAGFSALSPFQTFGSDLLDPPNAAVGFLLQQGPGWLTMTVGFPTTGVQDDAFADDDAAASLTVQAREFGQVRAAVVSALAGHNTAAEQARASDAAQIVLDLVAEATANASDAPAVYLDQMLEAADLLLASGVATSLWTAILAVSVMAEMHDRADPITLLAAADGLAAVDAAALQRIGLLAHAMAAAAASSTASTGLQLLASSAASGGFTDAATNSLQALLAAFDAGQVVGTLRFDGEVYSVYALTLMGAAPSEYTNYDFNGYFTLGGRLYGTSPNGTFLCEGADDDGAQIDASIRVGLSALGTQLKKAAPNAYVGYTSDGSLLLKVSTTHKGVKRTNVYKLNPIQRGAVSDNRFRISKALHSVYYDFEIANYEGADFELETIKVWRMPLNRRK